MSLLLVAAIAACGAPAPIPPGPPGPPSPVPPKPSPAALSAKALKWSKATPELKVPASAKHLQLIITPGWNKDERYAWLIADGKDVLSVYRTTTEDVSDYISTLAHRLYTLTPVPVDPLSLSVLGAYKPPPPPPPPDPGGFPKLYVESVLNAAWNMNREAQQAVTQLSEQAFAR